MDEIVKDADAGKRVRAFKTSTRIYTRRAKSEATLAEVLPEKLENGCAYHVISHGDIDALSYLAHIIKTQTLDYLMISTWVMAAGDVKIIERWVDEGRIKHLYFNFGEHMAAEYGDIFAAAASLATFTGGSAKIARNHSKVMIGCNQATGFYFVSESSANVNTNPRIEQTVVTLNQDLFTFYRDFYDAIRSIHKTKAKA